MYTIVCKYHRLNINRLNTNNWNKVPEKYDNNGKGGYFRFDDDNKMDYKYILSIT